MSKWYEVTTREYEDGELFGRAISYSHYFVYARAKTARRAKVIALRWFRRHMRGFDRRLDTDEIHPFSGMIAERITYKDRVEGE